MKKALVILSGGQDSATCLYWAIKNFDEVHAITFWYNQTHQIELTCASSICADANIPHKMVYLSFLPMLNNSALVNGMSVDGSRADGLPLSFVPNRNAMFITLAHMYAQKIGASVLVAGVCQTDYSGYPDCRRDFIDDIERSLNRGSNCDIQIQTPLMFLTKAQTFKLAYDLGKIGEVITMSHTCYKGDRATYNDWGYGCGKCAACELRRKGYEEFMQMMKVHAED